MTHDFVTLLRAHDRAIGATEASSFRFEETSELAGDCPVKYEYLVGKNRQRLSCIRADHL